MSLLSDFDERTRWKFNPIGGFFHTPDGLSLKVNPDGSFAPFPGSTVVFKLGAANQSDVLQIQQTLYAHLGDTGMLADVLPASSFHMTLHDLICPEKCDCDPADERLYAGEVDASLHRAAEIVRQIQSEYEGRTITLTADRIVNMVSKSLVLILRPNTEEDFALLMETYRRFDEIVSLPYPLTPHVTLAYFRPCLLDGGRIQQALDAVHHAPGDAPVFELALSDLAAQRFDDMLRYADFK